MACGLPVLTTDAVDNVRLVVSPANEEALTDTLHRLLMIQEVDIIWQKQYNKLNVI